MGLKNTENNIIWAQKTQKTQFSVFNKTLLFSLYSTLVVHTGTHTGNTMVHYQDTLGPYTAA